MCTGPQSEEENKVREKGTGSSENIQARYGWADGWFLNAASCHKDGERAKQDLCPLPNQPEEQHGHSCPSESVLPRAFRTPRRPWLRKSSVSSPWSKIYESRVHPSRLPVLYMKLEWMKELQYKCLFDLTFIVIYSLIHWFSSPGIWRWEGAGYLEGRGGDCGITRSPLPTLTPAVCFTPAPPHSSLTLVTGLVGYKAGLWQTQVCTWPQSKSLSLPSSGLTGKTWDTWEERGKKPQMPEYKTK